MGKYLALAALILVLADSADIALSDDFHGYPCTVDCSGHQAGYEWAEQNSVSEASDCGGNSNSFIEGCQAWAEEQEQQTDTYDAPEFE